MAMLTSLFGVIVIILGFGVLIFVHELGHFLAAKWAGIRTEGFAVGMGPVVVSWRKGMGFCLGSSERKMKAKFGKRAAEVTDEELAASGVGETEYSLRWLPIGGFVKMLGQDDANPAARSDHPRSYNTCPVGKRMVVVSAGVIMNVLIALLFFAIAFSVGVKFEAPVIGEVRAEAPASVTAATNAAALGITEPGLRSGDRVLTIEGDTTKTFADIQIATAMSRPGAAIDMTVARRGYEEPLEFTMNPRRDGSGLLSIGVGPARSTTLLDGPGDARRETIVAELAAAGVGAGVTPGMTISEIDGTPVATYDQIAELANAAGGAPVEATWVAFDDAGNVTGPTVVTPLQTRPKFQSLFQTNVEPRRHDIGLLGFSFPLRVDQIFQRTNRGLLEEGDLIVRAGDQPYPRFTELTAMLADRAGETIDIVVRRDGDDVPVTAKVDRDGRLGIGLDRDTSEAITTQPVERIFERSNGKDAFGRQTPAGALSLYAGTRIVRVAETPVTSWDDVRAALVDATRDALASKTGAEVRLGVAYPVADEQRGEETLVLSAEDVVELHELGWTLEINPGLFDAIYTTRRAEGGPLSAIAMGFYETHKLIVMTYLTIDRLFRGSVGVEQLRGPVGIIDLGAKILPRGFMYFLFFLGMISVNLAVLNFLPLPIVDGGLFLFLIYEKIKGKPPSVQFQNVATVIGLFLIGTVFVVTFYNDIARLLG